MLIQYESTVFAGVAVVLWAFQVVFFFCPSLTDSEYKERTADLVMEPVILCWVLEFVG